MISKRILHIPTLTLYHFYSTEDWDSLPAESELTLHSGGFYGVDSDGVEINGIVVLHHPSNVGVKGLKCQFTEYFPEEESE